MRERGVSSMTALPQGVSPATPLPQILTLRGGSNSRSSPRGASSSSTLPPIITSAPAALDAVDSALFHAEDALRRLRRRVRECSPRDVHAAPSTLDAALGGAACGYLTGLIVVGDPKTMAVAGSSLRSTHSPMPSPRRHICVFKTNVSLRLLCTEFCLVFLFFLGALCFAWAHRFPEKTHWRLRAVSARPARLARKARARVVEAIG